MFHKQKTISIISSLALLNRNVLLSISKGNPQIQDFQWCWHHFPGCSWIASSYFQKKKKKRTGMNKQILSISSSFLMPLRTRHLVLSQLSGKLEKSGKDLIWSDSFCPLLLLLWKQSVANTSHIPTQASLWVRSLIWLLYCFRISQLGLSTGGVISVASSCVPVLSLKAKEHRLPQSINNCPVICSSVEHREQGEPLEGREHL